MLTPIKTVANIAESDLEHACMELENQGYMVIQRKKEIVKSGNEENVKWTLKAKLNGPPLKPGRLIVE